MKHLTEIIEYKKLSNGQFAFCVRCCGNASTDNWQTMAASVMAVKKQRDALIKKLRVRVSEEHELALKAEAAPISTATSSAFLISFNPVLPSLASGSTHQSTSPAIGSPEK